MKTAAKTFLHHNIVQCWWCGIVDSIILFLLISICVTGINQVTADIINQLFIYGCGSGAHFRTFYYIIHWTEILHRCVSGVCCLVILVNSWWQIYIYIRIWLPCGHFEKAMRAHRVCCSHDVWRHRFDFRFDFFFLLYCCVALQHNLAYLGNIGLVVRGAWRKRIVSPISPLYRSNISS